MRFFAIAALVASASALTTVTSVEKVTITSCGPEVTNCPASSKTASPVVPTYVPSKNETHYTSTIYSTSIKTITACASTVTNCPAASTGVTTVVVAVSTTICPITASQTPVKTPSTISLSVVKPSTVPAVVKPSSVTPIYSTPKPVTPVVYGTTGTPVKSSSLPVFTGAANHAKAGGLLAGVGAMAVMFL